MARLRAASNDTGVGAPEVGGGDFGVATGALPCRLFVMSAIITQLCSGSRSGQWCCVRDSLSESTRFCETQVLSKGAKE